MMKAFTLFLFSLGLIWGGTEIHSAAAEQSPNPLPAPGDWDGVTERAKLDRPYEDPGQAYVPFGLSSYFMQPWRAYMDTQPASHFLGSMGFVMNTAPPHMDAVMQVLSEAGIRKVRFEYGWGNLDWNDQLSANARSGVLAFLQLAKKYHMRPLLLLNGHHAGPGPVRDVPVQLTADAKKGDRSLKVRPEDVSKIHVGYTGPWDVPDYCSAKPLITKTQDDGTCLLSGPLNQDMKAGTITLRELKYLPIHGVKLKGADDKTNAEWAASDQAVLEGWKKYVAGACDIALEGLGTSGQADAGFDLEVWNELTFGSNFTDINNYYDPKLEFTDPLVYTRTRPIGPGMRPDAPTEFKAQDFNVLLPITVDYVRSRPELSTVMVDNGFGNEWPWNGGADAWPGQTAYSRHYYQGNWVDITPQTAPRIDLDTINALGQRDGKRPDHPRDWCDIVPGSNFIPTTRIGLPEFGHCGFHTETLARDILPDSRWNDAGTALHHGRFTQNGDYSLSELWQTETNDGRDAFFDRFFKETKVPRDDPRAYALDSYIMGKMALRQYIFHNAKGMRNIYIFASEGGPYSFTLFEPPFFTKLDAAGGKLTDEVRNEAPSFYKGLTWLTKQMEAAEPLAATRALRVNELWEDKPRLMYAGDGTPAHPNQWNRDWFAFLPYQLTANKFVVPYYVVTVDAFKIWQPHKNPFDPERYQMADQDFEVTIGNCAGKGAKVSVYDPLYNKSVPVEIMNAKSSASQLTVKLKTVDYPRFLLIEEAQPGPLIQTPRVTADANGTLHIGWKTNIPVERAKISYGRDWPNRAANERAVPIAQNNQYSVDLPTGAKGILAARISVSANNLTCVWPRWDEDVQGQAVVPGSVASDVQPLNFNLPTADMGKTATQAAPLVADPSVDLPVEEVNKSYLYKMRLPQGSVLTGPADEQEVLLGNNAEPFHLRARYVIGANLRGSGNAANSPVDAFLPFTAVGDEIRKTVVKLPSGQLATLVELTLMPALHPEQSDLVQRQLFIPSGRNNADFIVLSAAGTPTAMQAGNATISSIFASCQSLDEKR